MGKPRAARKQPIVLSSDDEDDGRESPPLKRPKRGTLIGIAQNGSLSAPSQSSKPTTRRTSSSKPPPSLLTHKSPSKSPRKPKPIHKPITSFFSNVVPRTQIANPSPSPEKSVRSTPIEEIDDIHDSSDDGGRSKQTNTSAIRKRVREGAALDNDAALKSHQRFLRTADARLSTPPSPQQNTHTIKFDTRPWNEKYGPVSLDELAVHKKKVADVRTWLSDVFSGRERKRLLLLKGPAGSGKTTTISLLVKELGIDVHEWKNPTGTASSTEGFVSVTAQFEEFVGRTGAFGSLSFQEERLSPQSQPVPTATSRHSQLVLVEEFPNTFTRASSTVQSFRSSVLNYLSANTPSTAAFFAGKLDADQPITPIVMVISETLLSTNTAAADSFTAHRLLGPEVLTHPGVSVIEFNPIAPTFMTKALDLVVLKEARKSGRKKTVGPQVIQRLSELGDVRSAVSSLEFLCVRGDEDDGWGGKINFAKKKGSKNTPLTKMEQQSLEMITQRESTLGIFHAVGRVVYNKRASDDPNGSTVLQPPNWFPERRRPKKSDVDVDALIDEIGTDTHTFVAALHENYVLSCTGADSEETMDSIEGCIDGLSDADLLSPDRFSAVGMGRRNFQGTTSDSLRQEEMSFQVSVLGLLYNLPNPVKRAMPPSGIPSGTGRATSKGNPYVMYYPNSLRLWRRQEEIGGLLDMWVSRAQRGELLSSNNTSSKPCDTGSGSGVETWRRSTSFREPANKSPPPSTDTNDESSTSVIIGSGGSARFEMLLERLPYLPVIMRKATLPTPLVAASIREIQKITTFGGSSVAPVAEDQDEEDADVGELEQWSTDRPGPETPKKIRRNMIEKKKEDRNEIMPGLAEKDVTSLVLSDDDIED